MNLYKFFCHNLEESAELSGLVMAINKKDAMDAVLDSDQARDYWYFTEEEVSLTLVYSDIQEHGFVFVAHHS